MFYSHLSIFIILQSFDPFSANNYYYNSRFTHDLNTIKIYEMTPPLLFIVCFVLLYYSQIFLLHLTFTYSQIYKFPFIYIPIHCQKCVGGFVFHFYYFIISRFAFFCFFCILKKIVLMFKHPLKLIKISICIFVAWGCFYRFSLADFIDHRMHCTQNRKMSKKKSMHRVYVSSMRIVLRPNLTLLMCVLCVSDYEVRISGRKFKRSH